MRLRPKLMTVSVVMAGLVPILWSTGVGSDIMKPIAAPIVGGMVTSTIHVLIITPVIFYLIKTRALRRGTLPVGALTVMLGLNAVAMILMRGHAPLDVQVTFMLVAIGAGAVGDLLLWRLRPSDARPLQLHVFAFALPRATRVA